jgi:hypothetical protein
MRYASGPMALCVLVTGLSAAWAADATAVPITVGGQHTITVSTQPPPPSSRLKYRHGPVCMCNGGLSESDISRGQSSPVERPLSGGEVEVKGDKS